MLSNSFDSKEKILSNISSTLKVPKAPKRIVTQVKTDVMIQEIESLKEGDYRLLQSKNYEVYLCPAIKIPNILHELGRLREITFR